MAAPRRPEGWNGCFEFYRKTGDLDAAYCIARSASAVIPDDLPEAMRTFHAEHAGRAPKVNIPPLSDAQRRALWDPELDPSTTTVVSLLLPALAALRETKLSSLYLTPDQLIDPQRGLTSQAPMVQQSVAALVGAGAAIDIAPLPALYLRPEGDPGFKHARSIPVASIVGGPAPKPWRPEALAYAAGEHMALYRPELYARVLFPRDSEIEDVIAAARAVASGAPRTPLAKSLAERISAADRGPLERALADVDPAKVSAYRRAVDRTAAHMGFLLSRHFGAIRDAIRDSEPLPGALSATALLRAVLIFSVSDAYFRLRKELGLAIA